MKLIVAVIQPHKLPDVKEALAGAEVFKMTVTNALGCGRQRGYTEVFRQVKREMMLLKKARLEIAVSDEFVEPTIRR